MTGPQTLLPRHSLTSRRNLHGQPARERRCRTLLMEADVSESSMQYLNGTMRL